MPQHTVGKHVTVNGARLWYAEWGAGTPAVSKMWGSLPTYTAEQLRGIRVHTTIADGQFDEGMKPEHLRYLVATIPVARLVIFHNQINVLEELFCNVKKGAAIP
jgi:hypothetical protein